MKYVVTGVNRLTGEREVISSPHTLWKAQHIKLKYVDLQRKAGKDSAYIRLKVEPSCSEGELGFM